MIKKKDNDQTVSFVIFVKSGRLLSRCLQSLKNQQIYSIILIFPNKDVFKKFEHTLSKQAITLSIPIHVIFKKGQRPITRKSLKRTSGTLLFFIDENCIYIPNTIETTLQVVSENDIDTIFVKVFKENTIQTGLIGLVIKKHLVAEIPIYEKQASTIYSNLYNSVCLLHQKILYAPIQKNSAIVYPYWIVKHAAKKVDAFWTVVVIDPIALPLVWFIANFTPISPNYITTLSFLLSFVSAYFFFLGNHTNLIIGAFLYQLSFLFDCIDGKLARLKNESTPIGLFVDTGKDRISLILNASALGYSSFMQTKNISILVYISLFLIVDFQRRLFAEYYRRARKKLITMTNQESFPLRKQVFQSNSLIRRYYRLKELARRFRIDVKPTYVEFEAILLFFGPLFHQVVLACIIAIVGQCILFILLNALRVKRLLSFNTDIKSIKHFVITHE